MHLYHCSPYFHPSHSTCIVFPLLRLVYCNWILFIFIISLPPITLAYNNIYDCALNTIVCIFVFVLRFEYCAIIWFKLRFFLLFNFRYDQWNGHILKSNVCNETNIFLSSFRSSNGSIIEPFVYDFFFRKSRVNVVWIMNME